MILISPTAVSDPSDRNVFALNVVDTRGAAAVGEWARRYARVGVLHANTTEARRQARAFADAYGRGGHGALHASEFDSTATNLTTHLTSLREAGVEAIYIPANERELQMVLPQIEYMGLGDVQLLGNEAWTSESLRGLPARVAEGAVIATPLLRESDAVAWRDFVARFEQLHRRTLDNPIPALGYDAALLAVHMLREGTGDVDAFRGATGVFRVADDAITRRPFLVRLSAGRLVPVN